ncbi:CGNR zinc finger domain-containing protein [Pseudonocardia eucalypti]|uniref:CGNR zinc finger domain-containing protein n=1 Tax=Pseudonocardia eucalypti TaxID=648755 RepID=A0ABP9Q788_9PSEU|nr:putative RNA-binding Zn ribbon-like protein [Pseudonocardia eucalypti]
MEDFRFDGGATWLNLLATQGQSFGAHPVERLESTERLAEWLARVELTPRLPPGPEDLARTRTLRESLRHVALAAVTGAAPPADRLETVRGFLAGTPAAGPHGGTPPGAGPHNAGPHGGAEAVRVVDGRLRLPDPADTGEALARLADQAVRHLTGAERHHLRVCAEHDCRWIFSDPAGRRRWCPAPACASRGRVRAMRARRRTTDSV